MKIHFFLKQEFVFDNKLPNFIEFGWDTVFSSLKILFKLNVISYILTSNEIHPQFNYHYTDCNTEHTQIFQIPPFRGRFEKNE